jgi:transposase-like protein
MPRHHRSHGTEFKRQVVAGYHAGETLHALARRRDLSRNPIRTWIEKAEAGALGEDAAELLADYEARIAALERLAGRPSGEIELSQKGSNAPNSRREARLPPRPSARQHFDPTGVRLDGRGAIEFLCRTRRQAR